MTENDENQPNCEKRPQNDENHPALKKGVISLTYLPQIYHKIDKPPLFPKNGQKTRKTPKNGQKNGSEKALFWYTSVFWKTPVEVVRILKKTLKTP